MTSTRLLFRALLVAALVAAAPRPSSGAAASTLDVPYLPQTEALCGGAAVAMVFRYWGDRHADVQQFEPLVDRRAGGIAADVLVESVRQRRWRAAQLDGSLSVLREHLDRRQPLIVLLRDRPGRFHYVVAVGADAEHVYLHDPAWGPARPVPVSRLLADWGATGFWTLLVLPGDATAGPAAPDESPRAAVPPAAIASVRPAAGRCANLLSGALDEIERRGLSVAAEVLTAVRQQCPDESAPLRELSGVRFVERRWREAESLAGEAVERDPTDTYAWDVLGSSRFMQDRIAAALAAWNRIGRPRLDSVKIDGLSRTRYARVAETLGLRPNEILTDRQYRLAERRLQDLPTRSRARIGVRPDVDGFATVDVAIVERTGAPRGPMEWVGAGAVAAVTREVRAGIVAPSGQGELWELSGRVWESRPRASARFIVPRGGRVPGLWRVETAWEEQSYAPEPGRAPIREVQLSGGLAVSGWLAPALRVELGTSLDSWNHVRRTASVAGTVETRLLDDRGVLSATARAWMPLTEGRGFQALALRGAFRSSRAPDRWVHVMTLGVEGVTAAAPLALWTGAGAGHARPALARAHPLLDAGVVTGPIFGRRLAHVSAETVRWLDRTRLPRIGVAGFADVARAGERLPDASGLPLHVDAGVGLRVRLPGRDGVLRLDYGRGLRDGHQALTVGWQP